MYLSGEITKVNVWKSFLVALMNNPKAKMSRCQLELPNLLTSPCELFIWFIPIFKIYDIRLCIYIYILIVPVPFVFCLDFQLNLMYSNVNKDTGTMMLSSSKHNLTFCICLFISFNTVCQPVIFT